MTADNGDVVVLEQMVASFRRRWKLVTAMTVIGLGLGLLYAESQPPQYSSAATVMVRSGPAADPTRKGIDTTTPEEEGQFLSQLELAKSSRVAAMVAGKLEMLDRIALFSIGQSRLDRLVEKVIGPIKLTERGPPDDEAVVGALLSGAKVSRAGRTYVASISFTHGNPEVARKVAQGFAEAFRQVMADENGRRLDDARGTLEKQIAVAQGPARTILEAQLQSIAASTVLPAVDVMIMSDARQPAAPIAPRKSFLVSVGAILGAALGALLAGWRELTDRGIRDGDRLTRRLGLRFLGYLPKVAGFKPGFKLGGGAPLPDAARLAVTAPYSPFAETVRTIGVALVSAQGRAQVTAITSALPGEGKTMLAANLAAHLASQGRTVLLIDASFRNPALSGWLGAGAEHGLVDRLLGHQVGAEAILYDPKTNLSLLPAGLSGRTVEPSGLISGDAMRRVLADLSGEYQHVIIDLASLAEASDAIAIEPHVDHFVLAAEWGGPTEALIADLLAGAPAVAAKLAGVVVTRTDLKSLPLYVAAGSRGTYRKRLDRG